MTEPTKCMGLHPYETGGDGKPLTIMVMRGKQGYWPRHYQTAEHADAYNRRHGVSHAMREAMIHGSVFGWNLPIAKPEAHPDAKALGGRECAMIKITGDTLIAVWTGDPAAPESVTTWGLFGAQFECDSSEITPAALADVLARGGIYHGGGGASGEWTARVTTDSKLIAPPMTFGEWRAQREQVADVREYFGDDYGALAGWSYPAGVIADRGEGHGAARYWLRVQHDEWSDGDLATLERVLWHEWCRWEAGQ